MQRSFEQSFQGSQKIPVANTSKVMGTQPSDIFAGSDGYLISSDASMFSSSLPVLPHEKLNLDGVDDSCRSVDDATRSLNKLQLDVENSDLLEDVENHAIGSLLPDDEDELLAGIMDGFDLGSLPNRTDDPEDDDFFGSGGGLELEPDAQETVSVGLAKESLADVGFVGNGVSPYGPTNGMGTVTGEHPLGEHPSRTLFVRNINSNVEDSELRALFEQYGAIRTLYTACKHRGFVMISYYDIRAARTAMRALQNKPLRRRKLDIHFSIPKDNPSDKDINQGTLVIFNLDPSVSNDDLLKIFGAYGEVKEIRETPHKRHHKFIEYYDVRAADAALRSLNRSDIAGKRIKLEPSRPGGARRNLMTHLNQELEQDESRSFRHQVGISVGSSPPGNWPQFGSPIEHHSPLQSLSKSPIFRSPSPSLGNNLTGLASILHPQGSNSVRVAPIVKDLAGGGHAEHIFSNGISHHGISFRQSHSFPEPNSVQHPGMVSSFGASSSNESGVETLSGPQFLWGSPKLYPEQTNPSAWRSHTVSQPFTSNGQPRAVPYLSNHVSPFGSSQIHHHNHHHVGSAPPGLPMVRHYGFYQESPETSLVNPALGGLGMGHTERTFMMSMGARGGLSPVIGASGNLSENASPGFNVMPSPRFSPMFVGNGHFPGPESMTDNVRNRRMENNANQIDNKQHFQLDLDKIRSGEDTRTTLMIKNIPNKYSAKMLLAAIDENHGGTFDFLYLPIDFKNKCNVGYAFINMLSPSLIIPFYEAFNGKKWEKFNSEKVASLAYARIQGKNALVAHFQNSSLMNEDKRCRPIVFHSETSESGEQILQDHLPGNPFNILVHQSNGSDSRDSPGTF